MTDSPKLLAWYRTEHDVAATVTSFRLTFPVADGPHKSVLKNLERFCRANETCFDPDPRIHAALEGRREVYLRIQDYLTLNAAELMEKYGQPKPKD